MTDTYSILRAFADSWMLLALTLFFLGVIVWAFRPGSRAVHREAAETIFRAGDTAPAIPGLSNTSCGKGCAGCSCGKALEERT